MLKGIDKLLTGDILKILCDMVTLTVPAALRELERSQVTGENDNDKQSYLDR